MNGLSLLSHAGTSRISSNFGLPFPVAYSVSPQKGRSEFEHPYDVWAAEPDRQPPERQGIASQVFASNHDVLETCRKQLKAEIDRLKSKYIFRNESAIIDFILSHRAAVAILSSALPELEQSFGNDVVLHLEAVTDEDESAFLYAIVVWRGPAQGAESALEDFDERWWLNQPAQSGLTFTYELA